MTIQLLFLKKNDLVGRIIKRITKGEYTHCAFLIEGLYVYDTDLIRKFQGRFLPWNSDEFDIINLNMKPSQCQELVEWIQEHNGQKYDNWENLRYLLKTILRFKDNTNKMNCTESIIDALIYVGILYPNYKTEILSPSDVYKIMKNKENAF